MCKISLPLSLASLPVVALIVVLVPAHSRAQTATATDAKVQTPQLASPERASLAGQLSSVTFGPADVARGAFSLPSPFSSPAERGALLAKVFPTYSADAGVSEWGTGWGATLAMTRSRLSGDVDYATDDLSGPFGRMVQGTDGAWYPAGLSSQVRVIWSGDVITAYQPDGTVLTYGGAARVTTSKGTYAWHLTDVRTVTDRRTRLEWTANASGRLFLSAVSYGGVGDDWQYRIELEYETLVLPFEDYRSSALKALDRRVKQVRVLAKNAVTGAFQERWRYDLRYQGEGFGPGFFLVSAQQIFPNGEMAPAVTYGYARATEKLAAAALTSSPGVAAVLGAVTQDALQPTKSSLWDMERDGRVDLEYAVDYRTIRQTDSGLELVPLGPMPGDVYSGCRKPVSAYNVPRLIAQLRAGAGDENAYVVELKSDAYGQYTYFNACNREGQRLGGQTLSGSWAPSSTVRLVDVDRDHRPDLVRVQNGVLRVLPNTSTATSFSFGTAKAYTLTPAFTPDTAWVQDYNGDGIPDAIARHATGVVVWFGRGGGVIGGAGRSFSFRTAGGTNLTTLSEYGMTWVDANRDGLVDVILTRAVTNTTSLFMNSGTGFVETLVPAFRGVDAYMSKPVVADLSGSGNTEVSYTKAFQAWKVELDGPETGLMAWADDGKGTVLAFEYGRAAPEPGARHRQAVLAKLTLRSSGLDDVTYGYDYAAPVLHSTGKFLVGYGEVTRTDPLSTSWSRFHNDDVSTALPLEVSTSDALAPGVERFQTSTYTAATFRGIAWKRIAAEQQGWRTLDGATTVNEGAVYSGWLNEICLTRVERQLASGALTVETEYVDPLPSALAESLACLRRRVVEIGTHPEPSFDFRHETLVDLNELGLVTRVSAVSPDGPWTLQDVGYTAESFVETVSVPGRGMTTVRYEPGTRLVQAITSPLGVVTELVDRDPVRDLPLQHRTTRGALVHNRWYGFDGRERLVSDWDDLGASNRFNPDRTWAYRDPTLSMPGAITETTLVDPATLSVRTEVELVTAGGKAVTSAGQVPGGGFAFGALTRTFRATGRTEARQRMHLAAGMSPLDLDWAALYDESVGVDYAYAGPLGVTAEAREVQQDGVERELAETLFLDPSTGLVVRDTLENGMYRVTSASEPNGRVVAAWDEAGTGWGYDHDVLGRLRELRLPDGARHAVAYDVFGRVSRIERTGIGAIEYSYDATSGLVREKRIFDPAGVLRRSVTSIHDAVGRLWKETHALPSGASSTFTFFNDGATPERPGARDVPGFLTAVVGDGFVKRFGYRADGRLLRRTLDIGTWRRVETTFRYSEAGEVQEESTIVAAGADVLLAVSRAERFGTTGRLEATTSGSAPLATYDYDANGLLSSVEFANGDALGLTYDAITRRLMGSTQSAAQFVAASSHEFDARGLVARESFAVGTTSIARAYLYTPQRFLSTSTDAQAAYAYAFEPGGLPTRIVHGTAARDVVRTPGRIAAGPLVYDFDSLGRVVRRGDLTLEYGPTGEVVAASRGARRWTFIYDEAGHRLAKLENGVPIAAYVAEGYLDGAGLTQPVTLGGRVVGVLRDGVYETIATDLRGTVIAEKDGTPLFASPFGSRDIHPAIAAAIDFVEKGFDADLGLVRMGVRDYDADLNQFTTPDPLVLEEPERVFKKRFAGNLYGYAGGDPISYVDPAGTEEKMNPWLARGIGLLQLGGSALELAGGVGALAVPEPTGLTKVGGVLLIGHGLDTGQTALRTLWTGEVKHTLTQQGSQAAASAVGASPETARRIGIGVDIAAGAGPSLAVAAGRRLAVAGAEEGASVSLAYLHRGATEIGHNVVGVASEGSAAWFHLAGKPAASFASRGMPSGYAITTIPVAASSARSAMTAAQQMTVDLASTTWRAAGPNCATTAREVITAAGVATPEWARSPLLLHVGVNYGYATTAVGSAVTTAGSNTEK